MHHGRHPDRADAKGICAAGGADATARRGGIPLRSAGIAWDDSYDNRSNVVDVYIGYLRQKVDRPFGTDSIETVRGFGYRLRTEET